ncbi:hypothetical protein LMIV_p081 (plasmid) [Listeria monocytogenes FSL J1-208]|nr:hypothetical protein LMIV_p081 [Listeria monocytogenes FSL J1-208]
MNTKKYIDERGNERSFSLFGVKKEGGLSNESGNGEKLSQI